jgi:hypothetical protein
VKTRFDVGRIRLSGDSEAMTKELRDYLAA